MTTTLLLLGPPEIWRDGQKLDIPRRKSRALLFFLAAERSSVPRERLLALLWPDLPRPAALQTLRTTLHSLRRLLGTVLLIDGERLALAPDCDVDLWTLDDAYHAAAAELLAPALGRYRGEVLAGFTVPDAPDFEDWVDALRARCRRVVLRGWTLLAGQYERAGNLIAATEALERALAIDPLQEDIQRQAMALEYRAGARVAAIRRFERLRELLDSELGVPPMEETRALYDAIITDTVTERNGVAAAAGTLLRPPAMLLPVEPVVSHQAGESHQWPEPLPFTGRSAELEEMKRAIADGNVLLIEGPAGIGKTRLVNECLATVDMLVLRGAARELDQVLPYQPVAEALRQLLALPVWHILREQQAIAPVWLAEAARLVPELVLEGSASPDRLAPPADEPRMREGLSQLLRTLARYHATVLVVDDLHWADTATLGLLAYLARQRVAPLTLIATARPFEPRSPSARFVYTLMREGRLTRLVLDRLDDQAVAGLARRISVRSGDALAHWLQANAEGNPYIIVELLRHARARGILDADGTLHSARLEPSPVVPPTIYSLVESRLARLSAPARRVLDAAVAVGRSFEPDIVSHAAALSEEAVLDALDELAAAGLLHRHGDGRYSFDHALTMEVALRDVGEARHRLLHRRVAEALETLRSREPDASAGLIAAHYAEGGDPDRAARYAVRAARHATRLAAWSEAVVFYTQALAGESGVARHEILLSLGDVYLQSGETARASETFRAARDAALQRGDRAEADLATLGLARSLLAQARYAEVMTLAADVASGGDAALALQAEILLGTALSLEGADLDAAAWRLRRAAMVAEASARPDMLAHVRFELGGVLAQQGDLEAAVACYRAALDVAEQDTSPATATWRILALNNLAYHVHLMGDIQQAAEYARRGMALAQEHGAIGLQPYLFSTAGEIALARGALEEAEEQFMAGLELAQRLGMQERIAGLMANLGLVARRRGDLALAIHRLSTALARADGLGIRHLAAHIRIWLAPLLPPLEARTILAEARAIAAAGGRRLLLAQIAELDSNQHGGAMYAAQTPTP
ncbi:MAG: AAA family ATPase [Chloroflexi bacterium]|nr:AAA family ATPase [Chloroflexota bacterium]